MAYKTKFLHYATQAKFDTDLANGLIDSKSIVFIQDTKRIWTHGNFFDTLWNYIGGKPATFAPSAHTLDSHSNVTITSNTAGEILKWDGSKWINNTLAEAGIAAASHTHNYLPLTGGTITGSVYNMLELKRSDANGSSILFSNSAGNLGKLGFVSNGVFHLGTGTSTDGVGNLLQISTTGATTFYNSVTAPSFIGSLSGNASTATKTLATVTGTGTIELVRGVMADNDYFRILIGGTASNAGYVEIATADDGTEPIYVRQYTGVFANLVRTATLLDSSGNTTFPGSVTATSFLGNASAATALTTNAGSNTNPIYFSGGKPTASSYSFGNASGNIPISNGTLNSNLNADLLDGQHGSYYDQRAYTVANNYLGGYYVSGGSEKPNNAIFGAGKLKLAMLSGSNLGFGGTWNDVLWLSSYTGGDVKGSFALVFDKYSDNIYFSRQNYDSASWGIGYRIYHSGNLTNLNQLTTRNFSDLQNKPTTLSGYGISDASGILTQLKTVDGSGSGLDADLLDGYHASSLLKDITVNYGTTITSANNYPTDLLSGIHRTHISNIEYASILTGYDYNGKYWQLRFRPSDNRNIYYRNNASTAWSTIAFTDSDITGNAATATRLQTARTIAGVSFDGTANIGIPFANLSSKPTTLSGYGITDAANINHTHGLTRHSLAAPAFIDGLTTSNFRTTLFGSSTRGYNISTARWHETNVLGLGYYGTMIAWSGADTHGFLALNYNSQGAVIGGGSADNIRWSATLLNSLNYNNYAPTKTGIGASGTWGIDITGNAANATNISNGGTVTLASATESNSITITQPSYVSGKPVKLLNFNWYATSWSLGNIRGGSTDTLGLGIYLNSTEIGRFTSSGWSGNSSTATTSTTAINLKSNATTGVMQIVGPTASTTRVMTIPDQSFNVAAINIGQTYSATNTFTVEQYFNNGIRVNQTAGTGIGISLYGSSASNPTYGMMFATTASKGTHGSVNGDWATYFTMSTTAGRGWIFTTDPSGTTGNIASISNTGNMTINGGLTSSFVTTNPGNGFILGDYGWVIYNGNLSMRYTGSFPFYITSSGYVYSPGYYQSSDIKLKNIVKDFYISKEDVFNIPIFYYEYKDKKGLQIGTSAQAVEKIIPELVSKESEYLTVQYDKFGLIALSLLKEQDIEIQKLKEEIKLLKNNK